MDTWTRKDGRFYCAWIERDLLGLVVVTAYGGANRPARYRSIPVASVEEGERTLYEIAKRRMAHGYVASSKG